MVNGIEGAFKALVFFDTEQTVEIAFHRLHNTAGTFVVDDEICAAAGLFDGQSAVVLAVEKVEGVSVIGDNLQNLFAGIVNHFHIGKSSIQQLHRPLHLGQFFGLLVQALLVDGVTLH